MANQSGGSPTIEDVPLYPGIKSISVNTANSSKYIANVLGSDYLNSSSRINFYWTGDSAQKIILDLDKNLPDAKWQAKTEWGHHFQNALILSTWQKGDREISILLLDDLDNVSIESLSKNYGISGPVPGSTLLVVAAIEKAVNP